MAAGAITFQQHLGRTHADEFIRAVDTWCYPGEKTQAVVVLKSCLEHLLDKSRNAMKSLLQFSEKNSLIFSLLQYSSRKGQRSPENPK